MKPFHNYLSLFTCLLLSITLSPFSLADDMPTAGVKTSPVRHKTLTETLKVYGTLEADPDQVLSLSLPYAGLINRVWVRPGQRVHSGQKLLEIITAPDDRMKYLQAKSAMDFAQRSLDRTHRLYKEQLATKADLDAAKSRLVDATTSLNALKRRRLDRTSEILNSPMEGIVTKLDVAQGQRVHSNVTAMLIASEQKLVARLGVEPEDTSRIKPGTPVSLSSVFIPNMSIESSVRQVHAMVDPGTHLVDVIVQIPQHSGESLILGSRVMGSIELGSNNALVVPRSAVLKEGSKPYVYTVVDGKAHQVFVQTGIEQGNLIEITHGDLTASDSVVSLGNYELEPGMAVKEMQ
jgi:RND family efflux transporter MFP subunit